MDAYSVYRDIQKRTKGQFLIGVVGPVRTGKSTLIRRFLEVLALPYLSEKEQAEVRDALPLSGEGKTITTVEPKFVPKDAVELQLGEGDPIRLRLIDCVGFLVPDAAGNLENEKERMVKTPWSEQAIPFREAAEIGTKKVIAEHSTIGLMVTCDGSFGELPRENFLQAEERTVAELKKQGKPFLILVNAKKPYREETQRQVKELETKFGVAAMAVNCDQLRKEDILHMLEKVLYEFPLQQMEFYIPKWTETLDPEHPVKKALLEKAGEILAKVTHIRDLKEESLFRSEAPCISGIRMEGIVLSRGAVKIRMEIEDTYYYAMLSELSGVELKGEYQLISMIRELAEKKKTYEKVEAALKSVEESGYGVILPEQSQITLEEPSVIHQGSRYGVKIRAMSPSVHLIRADIETEIAPIVGSEAQAEDLISYIRENARTEDGIWKTSILGKSVEQLVGDGIRTRLAVIGEESQKKLQETMKRIVNESRGRLICIIL